MANVIDAFPSGEMSGGNKPELSGGGPQKKEELSEKRIQAYLTAIMAADFNKNNPKKIGEVQSQLSTIFKQAGVPPEEAKEFLTVEGGSTSSMVTKILQRYPQVKERMPDYWKLETK